MMRAGLALALLIATGASASAGDGFDIVIPGRPGVPIIINGVDASYAVVEGDWGLAKGQHVQPTVFGGRYVDADPHVGHYYPSAGRRPGYGRLEIEPPLNRVLPKPAESYYRSWSAESAPSRVQPEIPFNPPAVLLPPQSRDQGGRQHHQQPAGGSPNRPHREP